jgi:LDH2 family malate/lactate/ureidoglycolate dehydrogenase
MWPQSERLSNQGGFFMALDPAAFIPREEFLAQMERFVDEAGTMEPFPGQAHADLPGGVEARMTTEYLRDVSASTCLL